MPRPVRARAAKGELLVSYRLAVLLLLLSGCAKMPLGDRRIQVKHSDRIQLVEENLIDREPRWAIFRDTRTGREYLAVSAYMEVGLALMPEESTRTEGEPHE